MEAVEIPVSKAADIRSPKFHIGTTVPIQAIMVLNPCQPASPASISKSHARWMRTGEFAPNEEICKYWDLVDNQPYHIEVNKIRPMNQKEWDSLFLQDKAWIISPPQNSCAWLE